MIYVTYVYTLNNAGPRAQEAFYVEVQYVMVYLSNQCRLTYSLMLCSTRPGLGASRVEIQKQFCTGAR